MFTNDLKVQNYSYLAALEVLVTLAQLFLRIELSFVNLYVYNDKETTYKVLGSWEQLR